VLVVTNGTAAIATLEAAGIPGDKLPWDDVLHDGPVPAGLSLTELSTVRARFIADMDVDGLEAIRESFRRRDERLIASVEEDEVLLWFEHDLYDQLQVVQVLDWYAGSPRRPDRLTLICRAAYVSNEAPAALRSAFESREDVTPAQLQLAQQVWATFRESTPTGLVELLSQDTSALPFVGAAIKRFLEEYPWSSDGLARAERNALQAARTRPGASARDLFAEPAVREDPAYMGDLAFFRYVDGLRREPFPLLADEGSGLRLSKTGEDVLNGKADRVRLRGIERWYGGVRITGGNVWRWNPETETLQSE
jgi:hypothetical protein